MLVRDVAISLSAGFFCTFRDKRHMTNQQIYNTRINTLLCNFRQQFHFSWGFQSLLSDGLNYLPLKAIFQNTQLILDFG